MAHQKKYLLYTLKKAFFIFFLFFLLLILLYPAIRYYHIHYHIMSWFNNHASPEELALASQQITRTKPALSNLQFDIHNKEVHRVGNNLSGLAYDFDQHLLIGIINSPPSIVILDTKGNTLRHHPIHGANDTESVVYIGNGQVALLQEKRNSILLAFLPAEDNMPITVHEANAFKLNAPEDKNNGPEGIAYHALTDTFYIVKERQPTALYAVQGLMTDPPNAIQYNLSHYLSPLDFATDLSGLTLDTQNQHLLLLSDEAQMIVAIDLKGNFIGHFDLAPWNTTLPPPQPEGITISPDGTIYIVSEPNLFYRLRPES